jgi:hypothetical protein|tara:strand:+ start:418 stop:642 length:225 start_codon:yes stop_codon:yes gene_type:complete
MDKLNTALILEAKAFAKEHYNNGLDFFVECYDEIEWVEYIDSHQFKNWREMKADMLRFAAARKEYAEEINSGEW